MTQKIVGSTNDLMIGLVKLSDIQASSDFELIQIIQHALEEQTKRLTKREHSSHKITAQPIYPSV